MRSPVSAALLTFVLAGASTASAQTGTAISLVPVDGARFDVAAHVGRQSVNRHGADQSWDRWYESASVALAAGYLWTPHLKTEVDVTRAGEARMSIPEMIPVPGQAYPYTRSRQHTFTTTTASGGVVYQFFENAWFHPFVGAGVSVRHERQRAGAEPGAPEYRIDSRLLIPALPARDALATSTVSARPFARTGFKLYVSPRAFVRTDLDLSFSRRGSDAAVWRAGIGVDF